MLSVSSFNNQRKNVNFGRAESPKEKIISSLVLQRGYQINGVDQRGIIMPGAAVPSYTMQHGDKTVSVDTGVGSPFSKAAESHLEFARDIMGINAIQQLPLGTISPADPKYPKTSSANLSPFSGSVFEKGTHLIDPGKMLADGLVTAEDIEKYNVPQDQKNPWQNNYDNYFAKNEEFFTKAHENFKKLPEDSGIKKDFAAFTSDKVYSQWLEKRATSRALAKHIYGTTDFLKWGRTRQPNANSDCKLSQNPDLDKRLFSKDGDPKEKAARLAEIKAEPICAAEMEKFKFEQFIAYRQNKQFYESAKALGVKVIDDVPIGEDQLDTHTFPDAFMVDMNAKNSQGMSTLACPDGQGSVSDWGVAALKPNTKEASDFVTLKYENALQNSDTARIDAAWQLRKEFVHHQYDNNTSSEEIDLGQQGLFPSVKEAFQKVGKENELYSVVAENIGKDQRITDTSDALNSMGIPQIAKGWKEGTYPVGAWRAEGIHDDATLITRTNGNRQAQEDIVKNLVTGQTSSDKGSRKILITFQDLFGRSEAYNAPSIGDNIAKMPDKTEAEQIAKKEATDKSPNWKLRQPENFQEFYYRQIAENNVGFNAYKAVGRAMDENKHIRNNPEAGYPEADIVGELLDHLSGVITEKGEYNPEEAQKKEAELMQGAEQKFGKEAVTLLTDENAQKIAKKPNNAEELKNLMIKVKEAVDKHRQTATAATSSSTVAPPETPPVGEPPVEGGKEIKGNKKIAIAVGALLGIGAIALYASKKSKENKLKKQRESKAQYA